MQEQIKCPKCGNTQLSVDKKGFSGRKAAAGVILTGGIGLLAGTLGSNKIIITCLGCGNQFKPGNTAPTNIINRQPKLLNRETNTNHWKFIKYLSLVLFIIMLIPTIISLIIVFTTNTEYSIATISIFGIPSLILYLMYVIAKKRSVKKHERS